MDLHRGQQVELRNEYTGSWAAGFEVVDVVEVARPDRPVVEYRVRRSSDGSIIPALFPTRRVRPISS
jgi:hypothetical protein